MTVTSELAAVPTGTLRIDPASGVGQLLGAPVVPMWYYPSRLCRRTLLAAGIDPRGGARSLVSVDAAGALRRDFFDDESPVPSCDQDPPAGPPRLPTVRLASALAARQAALQGESRVVSRFALHALGRCGARWQEAVSTALLGDWAAPLSEQGMLEVRALDELAREATVIHRQLLPLWRRRVRDRRVLLLETPLGDNLLLRDLLVAVGQPASDAVDGDGRLAAVLASLRDAERVVVLARAEPGVTTWAEAAWLAGADDPRTAGERVRRRGKRLAAQQGARQTAARRLP
ncbi:hypothetical protein ACXZ65_38195 [Streptomyces aculeolatus]